VAAACVPTILLVEDDQPLAQILCRVLSHWGYAVAWADTAWSACRRMEPAPVLALLDFHLPDGTGAELAGELRSRYPRVPLILMTGSPFRFRERPDEAIYFNQVLQKPPELRHLKEAISRALKEENHANDSSACLR
jgi:DNA-binding response OmpR family regulator